MTNHPITPPLKLVQQWIEKYGNSEDPHWQTYECDIATQAARWGADQELEACCGFIGCTHSVTWSSKLRAARRPKPPSLKKQALIELGDVYNRNKIDDTTYDTIRCALEMLPE